MTFCYPWDAVFKIFFYSIFTWRIFRPSTESQRPLWHTAMTAMDRSLFLSIKFLMQDAPRRPGFRCGSPSRLLSRTPSWNFCWLQTRRKKIFFLESLSEPMIFLSSISIQRTSKYNHHRKGTCGSTAALCHKTQPFPIKTWALHLPT